jgi:hypothetical protein
MPQLRLSRIFPQSRLIRLGMLENSRCQMTDLYRFTAQSVGIAFLFDTFTVNLGCLGRLVSFCMQHLMPVIWASGPHDGNAQLKRRKVQAYSLTQNELARVPCPRLCVGM